MSNVYGHCPAGCDYPVVTQEEFNAFLPLAAVFSTPTENTEWKLPGKGHYHISLEYNGWRLDFGYVYFDNIYTYTPFAKGDMVYICEIAADGTVNVKCAASFTSNFEDIEKAVYKLYTATISYGVYPRLANTEGF